MAENTETQSESLAEKAYADTAAATDTVTDTVGLPAGEPVAAAPPSTANRLTPLPVRAATMTRSAV